MTRAPLALTDAEIARELRDRFGVPEANITALLNGRAANGTAPVVRTRAPAARPTPPHARPAVVLAWCAHVGLPAPVFEYKFHATRKWAFDLAWPSTKTACEVEGMDHRRGKRFASDLVKYSEGAIQGWCIIRVTPHNLFKPATADMIRRALARAMPRA